MTHRDRIKAVLDFKPPDRLPCHETPWEQTLTAWQKQGLPSDRDYADFFDFDLDFMFLDTSPRFEQKILARERGSITYEDRFGYTVTKPEGISASLHFLKHRTSDKLSWEETKRRLRLSDNPAASARIDTASYFGHFDPYPTWDEARAVYQQLYALDRYLLFMVYGPWEATWRHRGMENLLYDTIDDPDWAREMAESYQDLVLALLDRCLAFGLRPDGVITADDLGSSRAPLISPQSWIRIFKPAVARLGSFLTEKKIDFWMHSDGAIAPFIDQWLDCGVRVLNPLECRAGLDAVELRKRYGQSLAYFGNIDAEKMSGSEPALLEELRRKIPPARDGGYIMHSDHSCPPQVSFEKYSWMLKTARTIFEGKKSGG